jgi:hypothetical protein
MMGFIPPAVLWLAIPRVLMLGFALAVVGMIAVLAIARRAALRHITAHRYVAGPPIPPQWVPARPPMAAPVDRQRPSDRGRPSMRRYVWGMVIILVVVALAMPGVYSVRMEHSAPATIATESGDMWDTVQPIVVQRTRPTAPAKVDAPPRKPKIWFKATPAAPVDVGPVWRGSVEHIRVLALQESDEEMLKDICSRLQKDLGLHSLPRPRFAANPAWVRIPEKEEKAVEHDAELGDYVRIRYQVELTQDGWQELGRLEQAERGEARMELAARGLGLFTILLGAIAAYIRLDEMTKGYYSGRLFLAAVGVVAGLGVLLVRPM